MDKYIIPQSLCEYIPPIFCYKIEVVNLGKSENTFYFSENISKKYFSKGESFLKIKGTDKFIIKLDC